jgi:hypothetical protein
MVMVMGVAGADLQGEDLTGVHRWRASFCRALIVAVVLGLFFPVVEFGRLDWDDHFVVGAPQVEHPSWASIPWALTNVDQSLRYYPLSWLSWAFTSLLTPGSDAGHHLGNLLLHAGSALLLFEAVATWLVRWRHSAAGLSAHAVATAVSLLWATHPLRVEVVAWLTGRPYALAGFFLLVAVVLRLKRPEASGPGAASTLAYVAAALSHPIAIPWAVAFPVLDGATGRKLKPRTYAGLTIAVAGMAALTVMGRAHGQGAWASAGWADMDLATAAGRVTYVLGYYATAPFWPDSLNAVYVTLYPPGPQVLALAGAAIPALLGVAATVALRRRSAVVGVVLVHVATLSVVFGLTERLHHTADRYSYLHGMLWSAVVLMGVSAPKVQSWSMRRWLNGAVVLWGVALLARTHAYLPAWKNDVSFFEHQVEVLTAHPMVEDSWWRLGRAYRLAGRPVEARMALERTLATSPEHPVALAERGVLNVLTGNLDAGEADLRRSLKVWENPVTRATLDAVVRDRALRSSGQNGTPKNERVP